MKFLIQGEISITWSITRTKSKEERKLNMQQVLVFTALLLLFASVYSRPPNRWVLFTSVYSSHSIPELWVLNLPVYNGRTSEYFIWLPTIISSSHGLDYCPSLIVLVVVAECIPLNQVKTQRNTRLTLEHIRSLYCDNDQWLFNNLGLYRCDRTCDFIHLIQVCNNIYVYGGGDDEVGCM